MYVLRVTVRHLEAFGNNGPEGHFSSPYTSRIEFFFAYLSISVIMPHH